MIQPRWSFSTWSHMKSDTPAGFGDTSYLCVMDSLIDHAEDMKELRSKGILLNFLGSDQEVAALFNEIERDLMPNTYAFVDVENKIENHYNNKVKIWIAEGMYDQLCYPLVYFVIYCSNFAIGLQVIDTVLSGIQTYYAVQKRTTSEDRTQKQPASSSLSCQFICPSFSEQNYSIHVMVEGKSYHMELVEMRVGRRDTNTLFKLSCVNTHT
ncbi:hypothetical protein BC332_11806 [Capsicum chinense]|nr:hypothetical protein BC332_11806 [Capsicum chinense]